MFRNCCPRQNPCCCNRQTQCCNPQPVVEPTVTNCIEKEFYHEVEHVIPVHTHVINKHIYSHVYKPQFTCSEECQVINNECCCNNFMGK